MALTRLRKIWPAVAVCRSRLRLSRTSLRARIAFGGALPMLLILTLLSLSRYEQQRRVLDERIRPTVMQVAEVLLTSLRQTMLSGNSELLTRTLADLHTVGTMERLQIINTEGQVRASSQVEQIGSVHGDSELGCVECHQYSPGLRPRMVRLSPTSGLLRVSVPIANEPACGGCHAGQGPHLGVLLADMSVSDIEDRFGQDLRMNLAISVGGTLLLTAGLYALIHWLIVRRIEAFGHPLAKFSAGEFAARLPQSSRLPDEIDQLALSFNRMADELERHDQEQERRIELRQRAIVEERERIARELHDGLAQLLGYVNTKAMAVRLMLKSRQMEAANQNLLQLEEAARELFVDVREAILGLKMAEQKSAGLAGTIREFTQQFSRLSGLPVTLTIGAAAEGIPLNIETELQLLRIVQESLANSRKHAEATQIRVCLQVSDSRLELEVSDDGKGFDPTQIRSDRHPHFGLNTMRERAAAIGADFHLESEPGAGTRITVRLPIV